MFIISMLIRFISFSNIYEKKSFLAVFLFFGSSSLCETLDNVTVPSYRMRPRHRSQVLFECVSKLNFSETVVCLFVCFLLQLYEQ